MKVTILKKLNHQILHIYKRLSDLINGEK